MNAISESEPTPARRRGSWFVPLAVALGTALSAAAEPPMRNEDVVRLLVAGATPAAVIERIRAREVEFDLADEMLEELRIAGVPNEVVAAMRERQAATHPAAPAAGAAPSDDATTAPGAADPEVDATAGRVVRVSVAFRGQEGADTIAPRLPAAVADDLARQLEIGPEPEARRVGAAAWVIACVEPTHVPDRWRSQSPLGRDFLFAPRHRILAFVESVSDPTDAGSAPPETFGPRDRVAVDLSGRFEATASGTGHRFVVGVAVMVGERWYLLRSVALPAAGDDSGPIDVRLAVNWTDGTIAPDLDVRPVGETPAR